MCSSYLLDYSATKDAITTFTRSLSQALAEKKIRVNAVAPGPIWTPLIPSTFPGEKVETFGSDVPMGRAGQPEEVASCLKRPAEAGLFLFFSLKGARQPSTREHV